MKNNLKAFVIAILTLAAPLFANATTPDGKPTLKAGMYVAKDGNLNIFVENKHSKPATVVVRDPNEKVIYERKTGYSKNVNNLKFDVNGLPDGQYTVQITNQKDTITQALMLDTPKQERAVIPGK